MVKVPTTPGRAVQVQPLDAPALRYTEARNFTGEAVERLGQSMAGLADGLQDLNLRKAEYSAKEGALTFGDIAEKKLHDPEEGLFRLQGKSALDAYEGVLDDLSKQASTISAGLQSPVAKRLFDDNAAARLQSLRQQVGNFVVRERQVYEEEADISLTQSELRDAGRAWDNEEQSEIHLATAASIIAKRANRGRSLEWAQNEIETKESEVRRDIGIARVTNIGPDAGEQYFEKHKGSLSADDARAVQSSIRIRREAIAADQRRIEAEAKAAAAAAKAEERERLETMRTQLETGAGSSADWVALADGYAAIGDTSGAAAAKAKAGETRAAEKYRGVPLPTIDRDIATLEAKQGKLSPAEASTLNGLRDLRTQTASRINQPGGAMLQEQYATGRVAPPLNANDPDSFRQRANYAVAAAQRQGGRVEPLLPDEVRRLAGNMQGEASERLKALRTISLLGDPRAIEGAARQLTGEGEGDFRIAATLIASPGGEKLALEVLRGRDALATSDKAFNSSLAMYEFNRLAAPALAGMPPDYSRDVFDAAKAVYAERARQKGVTGWDASLWQGSINAALGGDVKGGKQHGGITKFRDKWVSVPPGWTAQEVFSRIAAMPTQKVATKADVPTWPDGSPATLNQIKDLVPVRVGGTRYGFQTRAGRLLGTKSGRPYTVDVSKLPRRK